IRKLPHRLIEAFKATLEEVVQADLLLHVVDISHPAAAEHIQAVNAVLEEIGAAGKPTLMVFNKVDKSESEGLIEKFKKEFPQGVFISAERGTGLDGLLSELGSALRPQRDFIELSVPYEAASVVARLHQVGQVIERDYNGERARFKVRIPPHLHAEF